MKTVKQLQLSGLLVLLTLLSACQSKPKDGQTDTYTSGVIAIYSASLYLYRML